MQTVKQIQALLSQVGAKPCKRFGQCFLIDLHMMERVFETAELTGDETVLEVGPGTGSLTEELLKRSSRVVAAEIDRGLARLLRGHFADEEKFTLIEGDALARKSEIAPAILQAVAPNAHLVANLPYNIATPLVINCLIESWRSLRGEGVRFERMTFTVQKEVAQRLAAKSGQEYGIVSVIASILGRVQLGSVVAAGSFWPAPKIASQIVRIDFDEEAAGELKDVETLQALLNMVFTQRRKHIASAARARNAPFDRELFAAGLAEVGIDSSQRADEISPAQYKALANWLAERQN